MKLLTVRVLVFFVFALLLLNTVGAQSLNIKIKDSEKKGLIGATIQLTHIADSTTKYSITDVNGIAFFDKVSNGVYRVKISFIGYEELQKTISLKTERKTIEFQLIESTTGLEEFTVTARRPLITQEDDKMIIDPEPLAETSTNTLEVLESTPGLFVDQDGGIYLSSTSPAKVYINGREQKMSNQDISTILRSLPPGSVHRIEVMRTPSTKYDAASSGGIINIVLKKGVKLGRFGSFNMGINQGRYGNRHGGFSYNTSTDNSTIYLNANYNNTDMLEELNANRILSNDTALAQRANTRNKSHQVYVGYGINFDISEKSTLNYDGRINASKRVSDASNNNLIEGMASQKIFESNNTTNTHLDFLNIQQDFGFVRKLDTAGSEWDTKLSYSYNVNDAAQNYSLNYIFPFNTIINGKGNNAQNRHFGIFQTDVTYYLPLHLKLETGLKTSYQYYTSNAGYYVMQNNNWAYDSIRTNAFNYTERINAAYAQLSRKLFFDLQLKTGVRLEHTYMKGNQTIPVDTSFIVNRADWFPYVYLSRKIFGIMGIELHGYMIYRRTINRPNYQNLNPYIKYIDQFLYETGNPELKPQFTDNIEINVSYDDMPLFAIGRNYTTDIFSSVVYHDASNQAVAVQTFDNLGKNKETYFRGIVGIPPGKRYFFALGAQYNLNEYDGFYQNNPLTYTRGGWRFFTFHSLRLFSETRLTMSGFLMQNGQYNFYELNTFGQLNFGLRQTFFDKKLTISLNGRDVLRTMITEFTLKQGNINTFGSRYTDNQRFGFFLRYNFGLSKKDDKKNFMDYEKEE